ncbi:MAG: DNA mismatch repair protein MutS [Lachnospiraceae bacterium]|nr:DNA mismatch repair protein MutS [Lachnospiraceae bacterium]
MNHTERILEFDKIKELWLEFAMTDAAKEKIRNTVPCLDESKLQALLRETTEAKAMIESCGNPPLISFSGIHTILETAQKEGCLTPEQLEQTCNTLIAVRRLKDYLNQCKMYDYSLAYYEENLNACDDIREAIQSQIRNGRVDDYATKQLLSIRRELETEEMKMREKADAAMRSHKNYLADSFSTIRNGRICIPVKKEYRHKINGTVIDKSSTGSTLFVEPSAVGKHFDTIALLKIDEENEEMCIRYTLTSMLIDKLDVFLQNMRTIEKLDFAFSKGKLSLEYNGTAPAINTERRIIMQDARHPLMDKHTCVPLQFKIHNGLRGVIITGPNTGGKTVCLKTVSLNCIMAQCGLHVACANADICMNSNYLCDIGDGQNLAENLSTFSAHLKNILHILQEVNEESLVILDELGSGTDPTEGMGIAIAVLEELKKSHALFLVTTHYPEVKQYAQNEECVINARMDFDKETLTPLYQLIIGEAGESCAFSIAKRLGMPEEMLRIAASAAYGSGPACNQNPVDTATTVQSSKSTKHNIAIPNTNVPHAANGNISIKPKIQKRNSQTQAGKQKYMNKFHLGDSVMVYPDKKIGIVCQPVNEKGILRIQLPNKKIWINHKRVKLHVAATELYPEDYDFSIIFDTVAHRKLRHQMERKYVEDACIEIDETES